MIASKVRLFQSSVFTEAEILKIAAYLREFTEAIEVILFQAEDRSSGTILLICDDEQVCKDFAEQSLRHSQKPENISLTSAEVRFGALEELVPGFKTWRSAEGVVVNSDVHFDFFIFPPNWREISGELSVLYYHPIPFYIERLSKKEPVAIF